MNACSAHYLYIIFSISKDRSNSLWHIFLLRREYDRRDVRPSHAMSRRPDWCLKTMKTKQILLAAVNSPELFDFWKCAKQ